MVIPVLIWLCTGDEMDTKNCWANRKVGLKLSNNWKRKQRLMQRYRRQVSLIFAAVSTLKTRKLVSQPSVNVQQKTLSNYFFNE